LQIKVAFQALQMYNLRPPTDSRLPAAGHIFALIFGGLRVVVDTSSIFDDVGQALHIAKFRLVVLEADAGSAILVVVVP
jgi:hypothetical protein